MSIVDVSDSHTVLSPSDLNRMARELLEGAFPTVWIEGELSNVSRPASGHVYFTLKDAAAQLRCAMFRNRIFGLRVRPTDGMQVLLRARVSLYEGRGEFQLIVEHMEEAGEGALRRAFDQLKSRLQAEGLFDAARKRVVPCPPGRLGVITSASGAALHDVLKVLSRRFPLLPVDVLPVPVQGTESAPAIVAMLDAAARSGRYDALLLTRGGGSLEDLWSFNEESVARAIVNCPVPVVSAVGHEVDVTIADLVADLRAATPSAAAELLVPDAAALGARIVDLRTRLVHAMRRHRETWIQRSDTLFLRMRAVSPQARLGLARSRLGALSNRLPTLVHAHLKSRGQQADALHSRLMAQRPHLRLVRFREEMSQSGHRLHRAMGQVIALRRRALIDLRRTLHAVSPLSTLDRGYAILLAPDGGTVVRSVTRVVAGQALVARVQDGEIAVRVEGVEPGQ